MVYCKVMFGPQYDHIPKTTPSKLRKWYQITIESWKTQTGADGWMERWTEKAKEDNVNGKI